MTKYITILGKSGAGKSTIAKNLELPFVSAGDIARRYLPTKASRGMFVDQRRIAELISKLAKDYKNEKFLIFEGSPLSKTSLTEYERHDIKFSMAIYLKASDELVRKRLEERGRGTDIKHFERRLLSFKRITRKIIDEFLVKRTLVVKNPNRPINKIASELRVLIKNL